MAERPQHEVSGREVAGREVTGLEARGLEVGQSVEVEVGPVAHGGHCVARHDGQVLFVRHSLPGERVRALVTGTGPQGRYLRADAVEILQPSPDRVEAPCPFARPGRCGGCDWQHASLKSQRRLKGEVVAEQLVRLGGLSAEEVATLARASAPTAPGADDPAPAASLVAEPVPGDADGLRWRTRVEFAVAPDGAVGLRRHRSHDVVALDDCLIASHGVVGTGVLAAPPPPGTVALDVVDPSAGDPVVVPLAPGDATARGRRRGRDRRPAARRGARHTPRPVGPVPEVREEVGEHEFTLSARGFWQVHPGAATTFTEQVLAWLDPRPGERALDLYSGVGLFAVPLAESVGPTGSVLAVEADREATRAAERHLAAYPWAQAVAEPTHRALDCLVEAGERVDLVVLDPPRTGAGGEVVESLVALAPRAVVYVACDPAALARDVRVARQHGLELAALRVLDVFPMTHHVECVALLRPA